MGATNFTIEQQDAIDKQNSNILVSASAGSGKTAVLVERVIKKVIKYNVDIDKLLVVTFTNASAVELKERLISAIYKELDKDTKDLFLKRQLTNINRASITTIHSFCLDIIRSNFQILNLDPNFKICDEATSTILKNNAMTKVLEEEYANSNENSENIGLYQVIELFSGKDENLTQYLYRIYDFIQSFAYPFEWLNDNINKYNIDENNDLYKTEFGKEIFDDTINELNILIERSKMMREMIEERSDFEKLVSMLDVDIEMLNKCIKLSNKSWDKLYELLNQIEFTRAPAYKGENIELKERIMSFRNDILKESIKDIKKSIYAISNDILKDNKIAYEYLKYFFSFLQKFEIYYKEEKERMGVIDFSDIEHFALNLLIDKNDENKGLTQVALNLQEKFAEVYTDEYQDTSFVQEAILNAISNKSNRFMVGDIKQSIYRFRQAMPEIFNQKYDSFPLLNNIEENENDSYKIVLAKNFRSRKNVLDSINYIFCKIMSKDMGDCDYSDLETLKFGATYYKEIESNNYKTDINIIDLKQENNTYYGSEEPSDDNNVSKYIEELKDFEIEAIYIASKINELMSTFKTYDSKKDEFKNLEYRDIVILIRNIKNKGIILEKTFKKYNIPAYSDASNSLFEGEEIKLVLSFLRIIDNPLQDVYLVSLMYSIVGNFTLDELAKIRNYDKHTNFYYDIYLAKEDLQNNENRTKEEDILLNKISDFSLLIEKYINYSKIYKVSELLIAIYKETNIYYQYSLEEMGESKKANLDLMIEFATSIEKQMNYSLSGYISYIDNLINKKDTSTIQAKVLGENENVVRIMTIHKSKGLEFPVVILCDTMRKYNKMDVTAPVTLHHKLGIGINVVNNMYNIAYPSVIKQAIKNISIKEMKSEELRMLYVALTRAKEKLVIFATTKDYEKLKNSQFVIYSSDNKIDASVVKKNNTYFENILMALNGYNSNDNYFDINIEKAKDDIVDENIIDSLNNSSTRIDIDSKILELKEQVKYDDIKEEINNNIKYIEQRLDKEYDFKDDVNTKQRVSVSELKEKSNDEYNVLIDNITHDKKSVILDFEKPECIDIKENKMVATRKGTLIHFILEHLDFKKVSTKEELNSYISNLIADNVISKFDALNINTQSIYNFLISKIGQELKEAIKIYREQEFILNDNNISISTIQGIIDLYYVKKDGSVALVDFKTDRISNKEEFVTKYKKQLLIYKEAIEKLTSYKVDKVYIYSFNLNCEIEV